MSLEHTFSTGPWDVPQTFQVRTQELVVIKDGVRKSLAYDEVVHVRIATRGQLLSPNVAEMELVTRDQDSYLIRSAHSTGWFRYEDRQGTFDQVTKQIIERVALANPEADFIQGHSWHSWILWCCCLLLSVISISMAPVAWQWEQGSFVGFGCVLLLASATPWSWRMARDGSPREFHPLALPQGVLPG